MKLTLLLRSGHKKNFRTHWRCQVNDGNKRLSRGVLFSLAMIRKLSYQLLYLLFQARFSKYICTDTLHTSNMEMPHKILCTRKLMHASGRRRQAKRSRGQVILHSLRPNHGQTEVLTNSFGYTVCELDDKEPKCLDRPIG